MMNHINYGPRTRVAFQDLIDLAGEKFGGQALETNDEFFAEKENLLKTEPAVFIPGKYTEQGKWMDGWESRRKRNLAPGNDRDWCTIQLGAPGIIRGFNIDTAFFIGNFPEFASVEACNIEGTPNSNTKWTEILKKSKLAGGTENLFSVIDTRVWTHVKLIMYPDGGIARFRVHGEIPVDVAKLKSKKERVDLAAAMNGGSVVTSNDSFFGAQDQLIYPGRAKVMGEGWETRRKRGPGYDWIVTKLATTGKVRKIELDTHHYKGNYPDAASIDVLAYPSRDLSSSDCRDRTDLQWKEILPKTKLKPDFNHNFEKELNAVLADHPADYIRLNIYPDGGVSRLRVYCDVV